MASHQEIQETIDLILSISIAYQLHHGRPRVMKKVAREVKRRLKTDAPRRYCDSVINEPDGTYFIINTISFGHFNRYAINDPGKSMVI